VSAALLALFAFRHYGYQAWPQEQYGDIYGLCGAICLLALLWLVPVWWPVKAWAMGEELLTAGCSAAWIAWPQWFAHTFADERCSAAVGFKVGSVGLMLLVFVLMAQNRLSVQVTKDNK